MTKADRSKPRLGRGLSSLLSMSDDAPAEAASLPILREIPQSPATADVPVISAQEATAPEAGDTTAVARPSATNESGTIHDIPVEQIVPNPHQPRRTFSDTGLQELAASLKSTGLIQPILVRPVGEGYQLIAGERRWRAAKLAGLELIPAIVRQTNSAAQAQMALVENIQREDLNPLDRAQSYRSLMDQLGLTQAELAGRLGEERSGIANYLRLLNLVEPVRELVRTGQISFGHAKILAGVEDMLEQERLAKLTVTDGLSVRQLEQLIQSAAAPAAPASKAGGPSAHIRDLEQSLSRQLGMRVQVRPRGKKGGGQLLIHYGSLDQFDDLLGRMGAQVEPS